MRQQKKKTGAGGAAGIRAARQNAVKSMAVCAVLAALCVVILLLGSVIETLDLTLAAVCSLIVWFALLEYGKLYGVLVYAVTAVCALLLLPGKTPAIFFAGLTGWYPLLKQLVHRLPKALRLIFKLLAVNAASVLLYVCFGALLGFSGMGWPLLLVTLLLCNLAFLLFDFVMDRFVWMYVSKFRKYLVRAGLCKKENRRTDKS